MTERRFFVPPADLRAAGEAEEPFQPRCVVLRGDEHHHLSRVLRLRRGDDVALFDGEGHGYFGVIDATGGAETRVRLMRPDRRAVEPRCDLTLAQGIPHHDKMDWIVQKSTELGVSTIVPVVARRTVVKAPGGAGSGRVERWRRVAREAARQSGRLRVPIVRDPVPWAGLAAAPVDAGCARYILCAGDRDVGPPRQARRAGGLRSAIVAVGPEGGWDAEEVALGVEQGFTPLWLGPRVLRTETAGIVAVALLLLLAGELGFEAPAPPRA